MVHLFKGVAIVVAYFPWLSDKSRLVAEQRWHRGLLQLLNVQMRPGAGAPDLSVHNMFVVANHVSWLDIYVLNAVRPVNFVSKAEVRSWPIIGWLAAKTGTLFIDRSKRHDTARVNHQISAVLKQGGCVAIFPEGTTSDGTLLRPFHASLLQPAVHSHCKIWPVAIRYTHADGTLNTAPAYVDELSFADSLRVILGQPVIYVELTFSAPIEVHAKTRRELAREAELAIAQALNLQAGQRPELSLACPEPELGSALT